MKGFFITTRCCAPVMVCLLALGGSLAGGCAKDTARGGDGSGGAGAAGGGMGMGTGGGTGSGGMSSTGGQSGTGGVIGSGGSGGSGTGGRGGSGTGGGVAGGAGGAGGATPTAFACPAGPFPAPMVTGLTPTRIPAVPPPDAFNNNGNNFSIIEGPVWIGDALYVSEVLSGTNPPPSRVLKVTPSGSVTIVLDNSGTNGMAVDGNGNLVAGNHKDGAITRFSLPSFAATPIVSTYGGMRFDSPNDLTFRADGNLYFTDPQYQSPSPAPQARTRVYRVAPGATVATIVDENRIAPNGITLSPDGNTLYVTGSDGLFRYAVAPDGSVGTGTKIVQSIGVGDGTAVDCGGNLYVVTNNTLVVVDPSGNVLGTITVAGVQALSNAAFGGSDHKTLYITALGSGTQTGLFSVTLNLPGYPY